MDIIYQYTRSQALADGVLVDVTPTAREAGLRYPVALTRSVWERYVTVPEGVTCQDEKGRLWDIVWMLRFHIIAAEPETDQIRYHLFVRNDNAAAHKVTLKALIGPGDALEPVITVMLTDED